MPQLFFLSPASRVTDENIPGKILHINYRTVGQNNEESRRKYWATRSSVHLFACTARRSLVRLLCSRPPLRSLVRSLTHFLACGTVNDYMAIFSVFLAILAHSVVVMRSLWIGNE